MMPSPASRYAPLTLAVACVSFGSILVRIAQAPPLAASFYRMFIAALLLAPFALGAGLATWPTLGTRRLLVLLGSGTALALHFATWIASLSYTSVAASVLLVNMAPVCTLLLSWTFLREPPTGSLIGAMALAIGGAALIAGGDASNAPDRLKGDVLALLGAVTLSIHHVIGRGLREALPLGAYVLGVWSTAAAVLGALSLATHVPLLGYPSRTLAALIGLALVPTLLGHGLVNRSLRTLPAAVVGLFLLGEPLGASLLAYGLFAEIPSAWTLAGGGLVLTALALVVSGGTR
jgi:drug/metabolite transporter (DMT)-like permease